MSNITDRANLWIPEDAINDGYIRGIFKTYFLVLVIFIVAVGNWCIQLWVKHKLLRSQTVYLTQTLGWLHGPALAKTTFDIRKLPGGWLGWLMLLVTTLDLIGEYGVAITVKSQLRTTKRLLPRGGIMNPDTLTSQPSPNWEAFRWAADAQKNNYQNANQTDVGFKHYGIYRLLTNDTDFMATADDTLGYWSCSSNTTTPLIYDQKWKNPKASEIWDSDIWYDLWKMGKLYTGPSAATANYSAYDWDTGYNYGPARHTTIITASNYTRGELFNISIAIDIRDIDDKGSKEMYVLHCELRAWDAARTVESIAKTISIWETLEVWIPAIRGAMFPGLNERESHPKKDLELKLQFYLNAMIMVSGAQETVTSPNTAGYKVGVVYRATKIPVWVLFVCALVFAIASFLFWLCIYLYLLCKAEAIIHDMQNKDGIFVSGSEIRDNTPSGLLDWIAHAAYESRDADQIPQIHHLKDWIISTTWHAGRRLAIVRKNEQGQVNPARTPSLASAGLTPPAYQRAGYFEQKKGDYISLNSREVL